MPAAASLDEEWRAVPGAPRYRISDRGRVIGLRGKVLTPCIHTHGYHQVTIAYRKRYIHELVLVAFVGPCPIEHETDHFDTNRANNHLSNLRWLPIIENRARRKFAKGEKHGSAILDEAKVRFIKCSFRSGSRNTELAARFGVARRTIADIRNSKTWRHLQ